MDTTDARAQQLIDAVNDALETPTAYRATTPVPAIGHTPPVAQPGRPPTRSEATDDSVRIISAWLLTLCPAVAAPRVLAMMAAAPVGTAVPILALSRRVKRAKPAGDVHHHYNGTVDQRTVNTDARGVWAKNQVKGIR